MSDLRARAQTRKADPYVRVRTRNDKAQPLVCAEHDNASALFFPLRCVKRNILVRRDGFERARKCTQTLAEIVERCTC